MKNSQPWQEYPLINKQLQAVNQLITHLIRTPYKNLEDALLTMANNGGKYLRPSILILSAQIASHHTTVSNQIIKLASSIEILHMASLIHDDIIDDSDKRRGQVSIQARFGKDVAVYAGDLLFTNFFDLLLDAISDHHYLVENAHTMHHVLYGELGQMAQRFNLQQSLTNYLTNVKGKTAALFRLAAEEGAHFAGHNSKITQSLMTFGEDLGIAFQMIDDLLDYGNTNRLNKPVLEDLGTGVYSLPLLLALHEPKLARKLTPLLKKKRQMTLANMQSVRQIIQTSAMIKKGYQLAQHYTQLALNHLKPLPKSPAKKLLIILTKKMLARTA